MTIATITVETEGSELVAGARSYVYRLLTDAFAYPSDGFVACLRSGEWSDRLSSLSAHLPYDLGCELPQSFAVTAGELQKAYVSTFEVGAGRPFCPLYEGSHRSGRMKLMEDLVRFYEHFGLITQPGDHPDHLCTQLEFMHYMAFKEAAALAHGDAATPLRLAQRDFLDRHLTRWLPRLRTRLQSARDVPQFYVFAAQLNESFCRRDLAWLKEE